MWLRMTLMRMLDLTGGGNRAVCEGHIVCTWYCLLHAGMRLAMGGAGCGSSRPVTDDVQFGREQM
jgi:hypothetical protein